MGKFGVHFRKQLKFMPNNKHIMYCDNINNPHITLHYIRYYIKIISGD